MIKNDEGLVALEHYNTNPKTVFVNSGAVYSFVPHHNVSLAWVLPEHVDEMLQKRQRGCCGKSRNLCFLASQTNVNIWTTGNR